MSQFNSAEYTQLLRKYQQHRLALSSVAAQLNSSTPVGKLPNEVLAEIFLYHTREPGPNRSTITRTSRNIVESFLDMRVLITHVCGRWRTVALHLGRLWSYIKFEWDTSPAYVRAVVTRSGECLLDLSGIILDGHTYAEDNLIITLQLAAHRVRRLEVSVELTTAGYIRRKLGGRIAMPALTAYHNNTGGSNGAQLLTYLDAPHLRFLEYSPTLNEWRRLHGRTSLRWLSITPPRADPQHERDVFPTLPELLAVLRSLPRLQALTIRRIPELALQTDDATTSSATLANLTNITLCGDLRSSMIILAALTFPATTTVYLNRYGIGDHSRRSDDLPLTAALLHRLGTASQVFPLSAMELKLVNSNDTDLHGWTEYTPGSDRAPLWSESARFRVKVKMDNDHLYEILRDTFRLVSLRWLRVHMLCSRSDSAKLLSLVRGCSNLEELALERLSAEAAIVLLSSNSTDGSLPLPRLRTLQLNIRSIGDGRLGLTAWSAEQTWLGVFSNILRQRRASGSTIRRLRLRWKPDLGVMLDEEVEGLRNLVEYFDLTVA